ncbi:unnamed protein product [Arctogadus glacialis]
MFIRPGVEVEQEEEEEEEEEERRLLLLLLTDHARGVGYIFTAPHFHPNWKRRRAAVPGSFQILPCVRHPSSRTRRRAPGTGTPPPRRHDDRRRSATEPKPFHVLTSWNGRSLDGAPRRARGRRWKGGGFAGELAGGGDGIVEMRSRGGVGSALVSKMEEHNGEAEGGGAKGGGAST